MHAIDVHGRMVHGWQYWLLWGQAHAASAGGFLIARLVLGNSIARWSIPWENACRGIGTQARCTSSWGAEWHCGALWGSAASAGGIVRTWVIYIARTCMDVCVGCENARWSMANERRT